MSENRYSAVGCVLLWACIISTRNAYEMAKILMRSARQLDAEQFSGASPKAKNPDPMKGRGIMNNRTKTDKQ